MAENKTTWTGQSVADFIAAVDHPQRRADALVLDDLFRRVTGWQPRMWGPTIIGYGAYRYTYDTGHSGEAPATGFSPRKAQLVLYIMPGYADCEGILARIGKYKLGKACFYVNKLADVNLPVVEELIRVGLDDLGTRWPITAS
jgi:hypothetical protein